jgi:hypothetical protein
MRHFTFLHICFLRLLGAEVLNELERKCLKRPFLAFLMMNFCVKKPLKQSFKSKKSPFDTLKTPSPLERHVLFEWPLKVGYQLSDVETGMPGPVIPNQCSVS